jgi:serine/threonine protein kinase/WD40 repeat protein
MSGLIGQTLGQYRIIDEIGHGGMANVYRAEQPSIGREVAIKVLPPHFLQDPTFIKRFAREVQIIAKLQHPHILPVYDFSDKGDLPYIVMAYMKGGTLADLIHREGPLPLAEAARLTEQIASGLDHAHQQGIVHRDFKPSNVLLDEHSNVYLADFGIARMADAVSQLTGSGIIGTPAYMAPEATQTNRVTSLVDIYALGITLFEMLTGQHPYPSETPVGVLMAHAADPIPDICHYRPDLPAEIQEVINRAMAKNPADRYQTASALAADLRSVMAGDSPLTEAAPRPAGSGGISTIPFSSTERPPTATTSQRYLLIGVIVTVVLAVAGLAALKLPSMMSQAGPGASGATESATTEALPATAAPTLPPEPSVTPSPAPLSDRILVGHEAPVTSVALSPDGKVLASGSMDKTAILWSLQTDQPIRTLDLYDEVNSVTFSPDGEILMVGGQNGYEAGWIVETGAAAFEPRTYLPPWPIDMAFSPDQTAYGVVSRNPAVTIFETVQYTYLRDIAYDTPIWSVTYSPDSTILAAGGEDGTIILTDAKTDEKLFVLKEHTDGLNDLAFSPDSKLLASASKDMMVVLWDAATGEKLFTLSQHTGPVSSVAWSPDGTILASSSLDGTINLWNPATGQLIDTLDGGENKIYSLVFIGDGSRLASGMEDGTIVLWQVE